jgi:hypothetical protein
MVGPQEFLIATALAKQTDEVFLNKSSLCFFFQLKNRSLYLFRALWGAHMFLVLLLNLFAIDNILFVGPCYDFET